MLRRFLLCLILFLTFSPTVAFAVDEPDTTSCDAGTIACSCPPAVDDSESTLTALDTADGCWSMCTTLEDGITYSDTDITGYALTCQVSGTTTALAQGAIGLLGTDAGEAVVDEYYAAPELGVQIPGLTFTDAYKNGSLFEVNYLAEYVNAVYQWLTSAAALIAVIMIMIGGMQYVLARGDSGKIGEAIKRIQNALIGLGLVLGAYIIIYTINPSLTLFDTLHVAYVEQIPTETSTLDISALNLSDPPLTSGSGSTVPITGSGTNGVPYFSQRDYSDIPYGATCDGGPTISSSGCGPTSASMVIRFYGVQTDPIETAASFEAGGYRICGSGTAYAAFSGASIVTGTGLVGEDISITNHDSITSHLAADEPIIISVGPSRFTSSGHFIVLTGLNDDGTFSINDPNSGITFAEPDEIWGIIKYAGYIHPK